MSDGACILLVEDDAETRQIMRIGLELEGASVIEAESLAHARGLLDEPFEAVLLDRQLPDGSGDSLVPELLERLPVSRVIVHTSSGAIPGLPAVSKGDVEGVIRMLGLRIGSNQSNPAAQARRSLGRIHREWLSLCHWDPALPPGARPPVAESLISAVTATLERPQPLGWGLDPALEAVADAFGLNVADVPAALAELVCLREAFVRIVISTLDESLRAEAGHRLNMVIDRIMLVVADTGIRRLAALARTDGLTGLGNRRAFEEDLDREMHRVARHGTPMTLVVIDVDGLKEVNDSQGHPAGDDLLRRLGQAIARTARGEDRGYRIGGDEFAIILTDADGAEPASLVERLSAAGAPRISLGAASVPADDPAHLLDLADARLYQARRSGGGPSRPIT